MTTLAEDPYGYIINTQYGQVLEPWQRAAIDQLRPHVKDIKVEAHGSGRGH